MPGNGKRTPWQRLGRAGSAVRAPERRRGDRPGAQAAPAPQRTAPGSARSRKALIPAGTGKERHPQGGKLCAGFPRSCDTRIFWSLSALRRALSPAAVSVARTGCCGFAASSSGAGRRNAGVTVPGAALSTGQLSAIQWQDTYFSLLWSIMDHIWS